MAKIMPLNFGFMDYFLNPGPYAKSTTKPREASLVSHEKKQGHHISSSSAHAYIEAFIKHDPQKERTFKKQAFLYNLVVKDSIDIAMPTRLKLNPEALQADGQAFNKLHFMEGAALNNNKHHVLNAVSQIDFNFKDLPHLKRVFLELSQSKEISTKSLDSDAAEKLQANLSELQLHLPENQARRKIIADSIKRLVGEMEAFQKELPHNYSDAAYVAEKIGGPSPGINYVRGFNTVSNFFPTTAQVIESLRPFYTDFELCTRVLTKIEANEDKFRIPLQRLKALHYTLDKLSGNETLQGNDTNITNYVKENVQHLFDRNHNETSVPILNHLIAEQEGVLLNDEQFAQFDQTELAYIQTKLLRKPDKAFLCATEPEQKQMLSSLEKTYVFSTDVKEKAVKLKEDAIKQLEQQNMQAEGSQAQTQAGTLMRTVCPEFKVPVPSEKHYRLADFYNQKTGKYFDPVTNKPYVEAFPKHNTSAWARFSENRHLYNPFNWLLYGASRLDNGLDRLFYRAHTEWLQEQANWVQSTLRFMLGVGTAIVSTFITRPLYIITKTLAQPYYNVAHMQGGRAPGLIGGLLAAGGCVLFALAFGNPIGAGLIGGTAALAAGVAVGVAVTVIAASFAAVAWQTAKSVGRGIRAFFGALGAKNHTADKQYKNYCMAQERAQEMQVLPRQHTSAPAVLNPSSTPPAKLMKDSPAGSCQSSPSTSTTNSQTSSPGPQTAGADNVSRTIVLKPGESLHDKLEENEHAKDTSAEGATEERKGPTSGPDKPQR
jgi:hypothetical protein